MGRIPCCEKDTVKRGQWTPEEDDKLASHIAQHGTHNWRLIPKSAGLQRCGKSCRLRWTNYLRPDLKHGEFSEAEEQTIMRLHAVLGNRWSIIAAQLPGRTDNDVKNYWNTKLKKKLSGMGIDPVTHKPFSHLMAEIATALPPPHVAHLAEATLGCFKDEMLYLLTKNRVDFQLQQSNAPQGTSTATRLATKSDEKGETVERIRRGLSRAILEPDMLPPSKPWEPTGAPVTNFAGACGGFPPSASAFRCGHSGFDKERHGSPWYPSICTGSTCNAGDQQDRLDGIIEEELGQEFKGQTDLGSGSSIFNSDYILWELPANDHMNPIL